MRELIKVSTVNFGNKPIETVSARTLYLGLGLASDQWNRWCSVNIENNEFFTQLIDFIRNDTETNPTNGILIKDYAISIEFAKHISMMAKTKKGHEYRSYFLELEKRQEHVSLPSMPDAMQAAAIVAQAMRLPESGTLQVFESVNKRYGSPMSLPSYAVDAPSTSVTGSSMPTNSATELLKEHGLKLSTLAFNKLLEANGFIETLTRKSTKGDKHYKSVTDKGLAFGKNITSTNNTKETQPHWYINKFSELLDAVMVS